MADGDRTDYWAPDSELDSDPDDPGVNYTTQDGRIVNVKVNDFLDLDTSFIPEDPIWGSSFQVIECLENSIMIRMYDAATDLYGPVSVSPEIILNNYRKVTKE